MGIFFRYLRNYRWAAGLAVLMMLIELMVELMQPFLIAIMIDEGVTPKDGAVIGLWGGVLLGGTVIAFGAGILSSFFASHASQGLGYDIREALYGKVQAMAYAVFNRFSTSSLITRLTNDVTLLQDLVFMGLRFFLRMPLVVVGSIVMAVAVNARLGLFLLLTVPPLVIFVNWVMKKASVLFKNVQQRLDTLNGVMQENFTGMRLIRIFVRRKLESERFARHSRELMDGTVAAMRLTEATLPFILFIMNAAIIAALWFGHQQIATGDATTGEVVAVVNYSLRTTAAMSLFAMIVMSIARARTSAQRIEEALAAPDEERQKGGLQTEPSVPFDGSLAFENVSFRYPDSDSVALAQISFRVQPGQTVAIIGATGSGKSTLMQLILRLYEEDEGVVRIGGIDARELDRHTLHDSIGYVPQEVLLFTGTIRENIAWGKEDADMEDIVEAAGLAQIHDTITKFPDGYDTMLGQRGVNLSGGQKQRVSIARALVRKPAFLLLDDSTSALDARTEAALLRAVKQMINTTTLLITQKVSATASADLVLLLDDGRLLAQGTHEQLLAEQPLYRKICESQLGEEDAQHAAGVK